MERDTFNPYNLESSTDSSGEKKDGKDSKKKTKSASGLGKLLAQHEANSDERKSDEPKPVERPVPSFLDKLVKAEASEDSGSDEAETAASGKKSPDADAEQDGQAVEVPLESLTPGEQVETAQSYLQGRREQIEASEPSSEDQAAEAFLAAVDEQLASQPEGSVDLDAALDEAFEQTVGELGDRDSSETGELTEVAEIEPQAMDEDQPVPVTPPSGGQGGGSGVPPSPPLTPPGGGAFGGPVGGNAGVSSGGVSTPNAHSTSRFNQQPNQTVTNEEALSRERHAMGRGVLVGGVLGYLIGRRRGRIKTEKRMKAVQEKLEKQVVAVQEKIEAKEYQIRALVRERAAVIPRVALAAAEHQPHQVGETRVEAPSSQSAHRAEAPAKRPEATKTAIEGLSKEELLAFSAQIRVGETNLRRIFEAEMIDEHALKRLIYEYQAGHDVRRALAREFLVKELKFERDPNLRDILPPELQPSKRTQTSTESKPAQTESSLSGGVDMDYSQSAEAAMPKEHQATDAASGSTTKNANLSLQQKQTTIPTTVLVGLTIATILLALYAVWLTANR